ncbi:MAG: hypothetical protein HFJ17_05195 [Clostridia bacterium]|nr:hypothetical protein [Clostridia bacterium]
MKGELCILDLARAYGSKDHRAYQKLIESLRLSKQFKGMLTAGKDDFRFAKNQAHQEETIDVIENEIWKKQDEVKEHEASYKDAISEVSRIQKMLEAAEKKAKETKCKMDKAKRDKEDLSKLLSQQKKREENMKKFTLVHPTATLTALDKKSDTVIVCTKFDAERMDFSKFADIIVETTGENLPSDDIPHEIKKDFVSLEAYISALHFVELIIMYWAEDKPYETLYNSPGIDYILNKLKLKF